MKTIIRLIIIVLPAFMSMSGTAQTSDIRMPDMIFVRGGTFNMGTENGAKDELPIHKVTLGDYYIGKYEVTFSEFKKFVDATNYITDAEQPDTIRLKHGLPPKNVNNGSWKMYMNDKPVPPSDSDKPVGNISWYDAMAYCNWLSEKTGNNFSLPTEAEWEFAARGGAASKGFTFSGSNNLADVAWFVDNSSASAHRCGQKMANEIGIYDMSGNIREWCADWYGENYYRQSPLYSPTGPERGKNRVLRGGAWGSPEDRMRFTYRNNEYPYNSALDIGFRIAIPGKAVKAPEPKKQAAAGIAKDLDEKGMADIYGIYFDIGKWDVKPESYPVIDQIATYLQEHPGTRFEIQGHTDNTGTVEGNQVLSEKRAASIKAEIVKKGIDPSRLESKGYGDSKPIADNKTANGRTQNRRVTIKKL